ncbi:phosphoribosylanthranilate isomerase [Paenibacillus caseinilyticus]|uniref:N-(5'-phosphoribosyl)anthranilate isomerase n=1 Tax=Paenibacillus mucilaginosus K02 TaxID=997761 RepID=I0BI92_9BACL|nr:phosphoribosylanthranilate isomerase [Paenibacillus mucilaginosus]AFH62089.1 N-(5'-phosphoribosyl)anthranilate isomerase [Paenibacillus mucilaginosus K02]
MALVKICGLQTLSHVEAVAKLPVDYIGFVFARSKRQVAPRTAGELIRAMRDASAGTSSRPKAAGVFVNPSMDELEAVLGEAPLDVVQLHGQESPAFCSEVKERWPAVQVFKVFSLSGGASGEAGDGGAFRLEPYRGVVDGMLIDTFDPVYGGGSGKTFAWDAIPPYLEWCRGAGIPLLVAGGLQPGNVGELLRTYAPDGVDVSSGVETEGVKDLDKITSFVERVRNDV